MNYLFNLFIYTTNAPYFWGSMGFVTAIGMMISGILYNDRVNHNIRRTVIALVTLLGLLIFVHASRVYPIYGFRSVAPWATIVMLVIVGSFYILGLYLGYTIVNRKKHWYDKSNELHGTSELAKSH